MKEFESVIESCDIYMNLQKVGYLRRLTGCGTREWLSKLDRTLIL
jgi:hypothetical protein